MARMTIASTNARIDALASDVSEIKALLLAQVSDTTPAKVEPIVADLVAAKAKARRTGAQTVRQAGEAAKAAKARKGTQTRETLSRKDWNRTLTTKARFAGGPAYKCVLAEWDAMVAMREEGYTPEQALEFITAGL